MLAYIPSFSNFLKYTCTSSWKSDASVLRRRRLPRSPVSKSKKKKIKKIIIKLMGWAKKINKTIKNLQSTSYKEVKTNTLTICHELLDNSFNRFHFQWLALVRITTLLLNWCTKTTKNGQSSRMHDRTCYF